MRLAAPGKMLRRRDEHGLFRLAFLLRMGATRAKSATGGHIEAATGRVPELRAVWTDDARRREASGAGQTYTGVRA